MKEKSFTPILILVGILVMVAAAGGVYYFTPRSLLPVVTENNEELTPEKAKQVLPVDETANWKIYKDPEGTFEIKYPSFIVLKPFESLDMNNKVISRGIGLHPNFVSDNGEILIQGKNAEIFNLSINLVNNIQHLTNEDIKNNLLKSPHSLSPDNNSAWKQIKNTIRPYKNGDIAGYYYLAPEETAHPTVIEGIHQNKYFTIRYEGLGGQEVSKGIEQIVDQILSTFRFLPNNQ